MHLMHVERARDLTDLPNITIVLGEALKRKSSARNARGNACAPQEPGRIRSSREASPVMHEVFPVICYSKRKQADMIAVGVSAPSSKPNGETPSGK